MTVTSGLKCFESFRKSDRDGSLARMSRALLTTRWGSTECYLTWTVQVSRFGCSIFRLVASMPRTGESDCGLWGTPDAANKVRSDERREGREVTPAEAARLWPTAHGICCDNPRRAGPTGNELGRAVTSSLWATPQAHDRKPGHAERMERNNGGGNRNLNDEAAMWATPRARDWKGQGQSTARKEAGMAPDNLDCQIRAIGPEATPSTAGALNPKFVSWLQGYPDGWLNLEPSATPSSRKSSRKSAAPSSRRK